MAEQKWPDSLWVVRHGQSSGNVARDAAEVDGIHTIDIAERDADVPLSRPGEQQSEALGHWFAGLGNSAQPQVVLHSPYVRAEQTARRVLAAALLSGVTAAQFPGDDDANTAVKGCSSSATR